MSDWLSTARPWLDKAHEHWSARTVAPLRVRGWLSSPMGWNQFDPIMLEGALQHAVLRRVTGKMPDELFIGSPPRTNVDIRVPIEDVDIAGFTIARSSCAWPWPEHAEGTRMRNKRARLDAFGEGRITLSGGMYKSLRIPTPTLVTPVVDFFVRGDRAMIEDLLVDVPGIGRDVARGVGVVETWEVTDDSLDRSLVFRGRPMRPLPLVTEGGAYDMKSFVPGSFELKEGTLRAPYWRDHLRVPCVSPVLPIGNADPWWGEVIADEQRDASPPSVKPHPRRRGASGRFYITPHAVAQYRARLRPWLTEEAALAELMRLTDQGRFVREHDGAGSRAQFGWGVRLEMWRGPDCKHAEGATRLRFLVAYGDGELPQVYTVIPNTPST